MGEKNGGAEKKKGGDEGKNKKKELEKNGGGAVVLKIDMHCEGCASKIMKYAKSVQGVEKANVEWEASKLIVEGKVDPSKLRDKLHQKTKKKVELVSPPPTKPDADNNKNKVEEEMKKKPKEPPVTTAVLKLGLHCHGCVDKIHKLVSKTTGVQSVTVEMKKDLVTVTGTMDAAALAESLKTKMKRVVEVVPQKKKENKEAAAADKDNKDKEKKGKEILEKEKEIGDNSEADGKEDAGNGGGGGGKKKKKGGGGGGGGGKEAKDENGTGNDIGGDGILMEACNRMEYNFGPPGFANTGFYGNHPPQPANGYVYGGNAANGAIGYYGNATPIPGYVYGSGYGPVYADPYHAPQMFSDENPNACSIM